MREGTQLGVDAKASVATFGHIGKQACRCDTHLLTLAKAARSPPCTLPFLGRRFHSLDVISYFSFTNEYLALS